MQDEGQNETKWPSTLASSDAKPLLKHVRPIRANYVPRKYRPFEDGNSNDSCACSTANSLLTIESISETPKKFEHNIKSVNHSEEKLVMDVKSPLKGKDVAASVYIKPVETLSPKRMPQKNVNSPEKAVQFINDSEKTKIIPAGICDAETPEQPLKKPKGRPKGSFKKRHSNRVGNGMPVYCHKQGYTYRMRLRKNFTSPENATSLSVSPRKPIKLQPLQDNEQGPGNELDDNSDAPTSSTTDASECANIAFQCNICNKTFSNQNRLQNHMHWHVKRKMFKCNVCKRIFKGFSCFIQHQQSHGKVKTDKTVVKSPRSATSNNSKASGNAHKCNICLRTFANLGGLRLHSLTHEKNRKKFRCNVCSKEFVNFGWLKQHARRTHDLTNLKKRDVRIKGSLPKPRTDNLAKTSRAPKPTRPQRNKSNGDIIDCKTGKYQCGICDKKFSSEQTLVKHKRMHTGKTPYKCHVCYKPIKWRSELQHHCKSVHGELRPYKCNECGSLFRSFMLLKRHKATHQQNESKPCLTSNQQNEPKPYLMRTRPKPEDLQDNGENLHKCDKCDRTFQSINGIRRHSAVHREPHSSWSPSPRQAASSSTPRRQSSRFAVSRSPPKPQDAPSTHENSYKCATCSESFPSESKLKTHKEKSHRDEKQASPKIEPDKREWIKYSRENGEQVYRCGLCTNCDRKFAAVSSVRKHVGMVHRDFTDNLVEPPGLYDDLHNEPSTSTGSNNGASASTSGETSTSTSQCSDLQKNCTCSGRGRSFVYKNNKLTHLPSNCPVHDKESSESKKTLKGTQILQCKHCDEEFDGLSREKFQEHELSHEMEATEPTGMTYACFECEVEFAMPNELMDHYEKEH